MKNANLKEKNYPFLNFAIYNLHFALKFSRFQRAKLLSIPLLFISGDSNFDYPAGIVTTRLSDE
jgi:hypothetical protein